MTDAEPPLPGKGEPDADWSLLPREPEAFFGLEEGYDRRDLKRAYSRLLRRYKPERFPDEFQRLRAAYEGLERRLRYGEAAPAAHVWSPGDSSDAAPPHSDHAPINGSGPIAAQDAKGVDSASLIARLGEGESPEQLYRELKAITDKTPPDYYALSLLSDGSAGDEDKSGDETEDEATSRKKNRFLGWLLHGLAEWPGEPSLGRLTHAYLSGPLPLAELPRVLKACAKALPNDGFYGVTEGSWDRLLRERSFTTFRDTFDACSRTIAAGGDARNAGRIAFLVHALRFAMWRGDRAWVDAAMEEVDASFAELGPEAEGDFDALGVIREYQEIRGRFVAAHPLRQRLDAALEEAFAGDPVESDRRLTELQEELAESPLAIAEALPVGDPDTLPFYTLWGWVAGDTASRCATDPGDREIDVPLWRQKVREFIAALVERDTATEHVWSLASVGNELARYGGVLFVLIFAFIVTLSFGSAIVEIALNARERGGLGEEWIAVIAFSAVGVGIVAAVLSWRWWPAWWARRAWDPFCRRMANRCYRRLWRPRAIAFLERSRLDYFAFRALVSEQAPYVAKGPVEWLDGFVQGDVALAVYALALRFRR